MAAEAPKDVWEIIISQLNKRDKAALSSTCGRLRRIVGCTWRELGRDKHVGVMKVLAERGLDVAAIRRELRECKAVLTGSIVLQGILGVRWEGSDIDAVGEKRRIGFDNADTSQKLYDLMYLLTPTRRIYDAEAEALLNYWSRERQRMRYITSWRRCEDKRRIVLRGDGRNERREEFDIMIANNPDQTTKRSLTMLLDEFDLDCCGCLWDGNRVYVTNEDMLSYKTRVRPGALSRNPEEIGWLEGSYYEGCTLGTQHSIRRRIKKYRDRGFTITGEEHLERAIVKEVEYKSFTISHNVNFPYRIEYVDYEGDAITLIVNGGCVTSEANEVTIPTVQNRVHLGLDVACCGYVSISLRVPHGKFKIGFSEKWSMPEENIRRVLAWIAATDGEYYLISDVGLVLAS